MPFPHRGYKAGLLTSNNYQNLVQCETLDDFKLQLSSTDYGNFLANETPPISTSTIAEKATARLVDEFNYLRSNAGGQLATFLDYITWVVVVVVAVAVAVLALFHARFRGGLCSDGQLV